MDGCSFIVTASSDKISRDLVLLFIDGDRRLDRHIRQLHGQTGCIDVIVTEVIPVLADNNITPLREYLRYHCSSGTVARSISNAIKLNVISLC